MDEGEKIMRWGPDCGKNLKKSWAYKIIALLWCTCRKKKKKLSHTVESNQKVLLSVKKKERKKKKRLQNYIDVSCRKP